MEFVGGRVGSIEPTAKLIQSSLTALAENNDYRHALELPQDCHYERSVAISFEGSRSIFGWSLRQRGANSQTELSRSVYF